MPTRAFLPGVTIATATLAASPGSGAPQTPAAPWYELNREAPGSIADIDAMGGWQDGMRSVSELPIL